MLHIVCFHRVLDPTAPDARPYLLRGSALTPDAFDHHLQTLTDTFDVVSEEVATAYLRGEHHPRRPMCWLTFDDGYRDNLTVAAPILAARHLTATLFVTTAILQPGWRLPVDRWYHALTHATRRQGTLHGFGLPPWTFDLNHDADLLRLITGPEKRAFVEATSPQQDRLLLALQEALRPTPAPEHPTYLTAADLRALHDQGWSLGNHTHHHTLLTRVTPDDLLYEVHTAAQTLRALGFTASPWLAWPDGAFNSATTQLLRTHSHDLGLVGALSIQPGYAAPHLDPWSLPRHLAPHHVAVAFHPADQTAASSLRC